LEFDPAINDADSRWQEILATVVVYDSSPKARTPDLAVKLRTNDTPPPD